MGINLNTLKAISILNKVDPVNGKSLLTLGRQNTCFTHKHLNKYFKKNKIFADFLISGKQLEEFADSFFLNIGFSSVQSMDYSDFEGATIVHDLNEPVLAELENKFDIIIDAGTLEHVFNFPAAINSCMRMVKKNGYLIMATPANNLFGHGFYQFSPDLFYRIFSKENGFEMIEVFINGKKMGSWYKVADPDKMGERVTLKNTFETELVIIAKKISDDAYLKVTPQQSDYHSLWNNSVPGTSTNTSTLKSKYQKLVPKKIRDRIWLIRNKRKNKNIGNFLIHHFKLLDD
jgi:SAM-dependent methyltransferase